MTGEERYWNDPIFRALVDMIYAGIRNLDYTPSDVRDAAMLAMLHYEIRDHKRPISVSKKEWERGRQCPTD